MGKARARHRKGRGWLVRQFVDGKHIDKGGFGDGDEGEKAAKAFADSVNALQANEIPGNPTVESLVTAWAAKWGPLRSPNTQITDRGRVSLLIAHLGKRRAANLSDADIADFANKVESSSQAMGALSILRVALNRAELKVPRAIADVIKALRQQVGEDSRADSWTQEEAGKILNVARESEPLMFAPLTLAFGTGMSRGEIIALRGEDVNLEQAEIHLRRADSGGTAAQRREQKTKKPKAGKARFVPLSQTVVDVLTSLRGQQVRERPFRPAGRVFLNGRGDPWTPRNFSTHWERLRLKAFREGVRPLKFHCCRHSFVTWALTAGVPIKRLSEWVGASVMVIETNYAHVLPREKFDLGFSDVGGAKVPSQRILGAREGAGE